MVILCQRWAEVYMHHNSAIDVQVTGGGSGTGIAALINGGTDICAASRPMKDKEKQQVKAKHNQDSVETAVALDGLTVYLNKNNPVKQLSVEQLDKIYRAQITDWKDVGGTPGKIVCYGRENSSGTYAYFKEHVLKEKDFATEVQSLPGTAAVIHAVGKDPNGIGYGGKAYESKDTDVKECAVSTKEGEAATLPSLANVVSGTYPLSRKLFFYTAGQPGGEVKTFIDWVLGEEGQKVCDQVGYYPIPKK
jgi:phosphate transport system substrate-binding protein